MPPSPRLTPGALPERPRVVAMGDSVIAGYGVGGVSYADTVGERLQAERVMSYARSTFTVEDSVRLLPRVLAFGPDVVIVNIGGADGLVHAGEAVERFLGRFAPKSWRGVEGLEPKPAQEKPPQEETGLLKLRFRVTGLIKLVLKHIGVRLTGGYRRVTPDRFEPAFEQVVATLAEAGVTVVVVGLHAPDEWLWPRSTASGLEYEAAIARVLDRHPEALFVDPKPVLDRWGDFLSDHIHFNRRGHDKVAALVWRALEPATAPAARPQVAASPDE